MRSENEDLLIEAIQSIAGDIHRIKSAMCEEEGGDGIYIRGDIGCHQD